MTVLDMGRLRIQSGLCTLHQLLQRPMHRLQTLMLHTTTVHYGHIEGACCMWPAQLLQGQALPADTFSKLPCTV